MAVNEDILKCLAYFDLFSYPLTGDEISRFCTHAYSHAELTRHINILVETERVYRIGNFYSLRSDQRLATRREAGNRRAEKKMKTARRVGKFLHHFPFVRGVAISGSLSKNFADKNSDIDFFIITARNRLWVARTLMFSFYKLIFFAGIRNWFCMNYYIDEDALQIEEKNFYTAIEIATLVPVVITPGIAHFFAENEWVASFLPSAMPHRLPEMRMKNSRLKSLFEAILSQKFGSWLDLKLMKSTSTRWKKKMKKHQLNAKGVPLSMNTSRHYAKPDPANFQDRLLDEYRQKCSALCSQEAFRIAR